MVQHCDVRDLGRKLFEQLQPFRAHAVVERSETGNIATRLGKAIDEAAGDRVDNRHEYDRDSAGRFLRRPHYLRGRGQDHVRSERHHLGHLFSHLHCVACGPSNVDLGVAPD
jgi:hypothetical protein